MKVTNNGRGFEQITLPGYLPTDGIRLLVCQSSMIGQTQYAMDNPGSSFLWFGDWHHLHRHQVQELVQHLQSWLDTGSLKTK